MIEFKLGPDGQIKSLDYVLSQNGRIPAKRIRLAAFDLGTVSVDDYIGEYSSKELAIDYTIQSETGQLFLSNPQIGNMLISAYQNDIFSSDSNHFSQVTFTRDTTGKVDGFKLSYATANDVSFVKMD